ncbi:ribonuclease T2 family protein [Sphingomonas jatrophae]|uniref:Ribonuclease T2 n=1 Tax=Sphingomonas jatrophae TaxID=1166337 RepID=A0A1I6KY76_9SPHN|nr:ribonuclease T2 [Sphingomonas jatrophae]SFR96151.1 ribonuclease T2 [Sphingomonas jatrophae]
MSGLLRVVGVIGLALPGVATAQALQCDVPARIAAPRPDLPDARQPKRVLPIGSYTLAISWSPEFCRSRRGDERAAFQCGGGNRFGFVLHGLWPDGEGKDWPQYCAPASILPERLIRANLCATPSPQLLQHEWAKHGTCMTPRDPARYFAQSRRLYDRLRFPDMDRLSRRRLTVRALSTAIARANPGWRADMMRITTTRGNWLDEVWMCLDKGLRPARCPAHQGGAKPGQAVRIWRGRA